jgi:hypothetical protein
MAPQWSPDYCKSCVNTVISINTCAFCTSYLAEACLVMYSSGEGGNTGPSFLQCTISPYHNSFLLNTWALWPEWIHLYHLLYLDNHITYCEQIQCSIGGHYYLNLYYPFPCTYKAKWVKKLCVRIPCNSHYHFSGPWISQQKTVPIWSTCAILSQSHLNLNLILYLLVFILFKYVCYLLNCLLIKVVLLFCVLHLLVVKFWKKVTELYDKIYTCS